MFQNGSNLECFILLYSNFEVVEHMQLCYQTVKKKKAQVTTKRLGPPAQEGCGDIGACSEEGHEIEQRDGASLL